MYVDIGKRIRRLRKRQGLTQEKLAEMVDISLSFMGHIERSSRVLSVDTLCRIARALSCSADELLGIDVSDQSGVTRNEIEDIITQLEKIKNRFK